MKITVGHLFPDLLNLYGDSGNIAVLHHRLEARGIEAEIKVYSIEDEINFEDIDILLLGGGGEKEQRLTCNRLRKCRRELIAFAEDGGVILAVCGGYHILGKAIEKGGEWMEGVGLLDVITAEKKTRAIGDVVLHSDLLGTTVVGFENHSGSTVIGSLTPLGRVLYGNGNNGDGTEGVVYKNVVATNLHGPLLPKNPALADYLIARAIERRGEKFNLISLDDTAEQSAHDYIVERFVRK